MSVKKIGKVICLKTLEVYESAIDCSRKFANMNRHNPNLSNNLDGKIKYYKGYSFEYYDSDKEYIATTTQEQEKAYDDYLKWKDKKVYILTDTGRCFKKAQDIANIFGITRQAVDERVKKGKSVIRMTNEEYLEYN